MQISVYRSQYGVRWGRKHPHRPPFCERYTLICMGLPLEALYWKVVNYIYNIDGYDIVNINRSNKRGGGVMIYVSKSIKFKMVKNMSEAIDDLYECVTIEIESMKGRNTIITCMYRTPGTNIETYLEHLNKLSQKVKNKTFFLIGDFNINLINYETHSGTKNFMDTLSSYGIHPLIIKPTRITLESCTLIDNIFTNINDELNSGIIINDISDHLPIYTVYPKGYYNGTVEKSKQFKRVTNLENLNKFKMLLSNYNWESVLQSDDVDSAYNEFINVTKEKFNESCPLKKVNYKKMPIQPWLTKGLLNACKKQKTLYKQFLKCRTSITELRYKNYKNKLTTIKRKCKKQYFSKLINDNRDDIKGTWRILNSLINKKNSTIEYPDAFHSDDDSQVKGDRNIANHFNDFFVNVGPKLASKIEPPDNASIFSYLGPSGKNSMFLNPVESQEVLNVIKQCKSKNSEDCDNLSMNVVKHIISAVIVPFTHICNLSFLNGVVPDSMKIAKIIPLFKSGDKTKFTNYRPVALLPQFSKILEKLFCKRLNDFIDKNTLLSESQFGFRANRSTSLAILDLVEEISTALDNKKYTIGVFIDLKKAFDTIDNNLLCKKLEYLGVRGIVNNWLKSYLNNRKQYVEINKIRSEISKVVCGVPQGSVLGPVLFILYINDICNVSKLLNMILFADDTNLFRSGMDIDVLCKEISHELNKLKTWFRVNKLSLNVSKTNFILFSGRKCIKNVSISIDDECIDRVFSTKFLGVYIDDKLSWKQHISTIKSRLCKCLSVLYKCNKVLEIDSLKTLYCSLFLPHLNYCCEIWGSACKKLINSIELLQKRAIRTGLLRD